MSGGDLSVIRMGYRLASRSEVQSGVKPPHSIAGVARTLRMRLSVNTLT